MNDQPPLNGGVHNTHRQQRTNLPDTWTRYFDERDRNVSNGPYKCRLILHYAPLVKYVVYRTDPRGLAWPRLMAVGLVEVARLIEGRERWDRRRFEVVALPRVRDAVERFVLFEGKRDGA